MNARRKALLALAVVALLACLGFWKRADISARAMQKLADRSRPA
jgi:hypothetical protein